MTQRSLLVAAAAVVVLARQAAAGGGAVVQGDVVRDPAKGGVDADVTVEYDPNATTTATTPDILLNPDLLVAPAPFPSPAPNAYYDVEPPLPAPSSESPAPGPEGHWQIDTCTVQRGCNGMSCDMFEGTSCTVLEALFDCDCTSCRCALDRQSENAPAPAPGFDGDEEEALSHKCTADCVSAGTSCDYWEFNTCDFLESSKGCDCSGCQCTGGTCESEHADDTDQPECEDWCGNTMAKWESCEYCRCKACDFCVVGEDGETAADQLVRSAGAGRGAVMSAATATAAVVATALCR